MFERRKRDRRDDLSYVFVVTYGRSGSTLLAGILNSVPGLLPLVFRNGTISIYAVHER